jgi:hypothetical protein
MIDVTREFAQISSIATVLDDRRDPESVSAAREIEVMVKRHRQSYAVRGDLAAARRFLDELASDATVQIPDPGPANVERVDPLMPRGGVEDGTRHFNRGPPGTALGGSPEAGMPNPALGSVEGVEHGA